MVRPGDVLEIRGPYGRFTLSEDADDVLFVAAGSGIVPFRSMWRWISQRGLDIRITLLYASKSLPYVIYRDELNELARRHRVVHTLTRNDDPAWDGYSRRVDKAMLAEVAGSLARKRVYVCGPPAMCEDVLGYLEEAGVPRASVRTEKYD
jgi:ferredoxin-NADP reductase